MGAPLDSAKFVPFVGCRGIFVFEELGTFGEALFANVETLQLSQTGDVPTHFFGVDDAIAVVVAVAHESGVAEA